jgi:serine protease inhibitor
MDDFKDNLKAIGLVDMFDEKTANFSKMASKELYVSDGIHKAKIEFGEKGVKAAAVTVIMMFEKSSIEPQKKTINITFDKPFMYVIRDKDSKEIWFMGTVYEPNLWKNDKNQYK